MKKTIIIVFALYFTQGLIHNLGHPITPDFITELGISEYMFGVFFALMSFGLALGGPVWGILGDRYNKKIMILIGLLIYSFGQYMFGNVHNLTSMIIFRFVSGFGVSASVTLLLSYLIEKSDPKDKKKNIAFGAAMMALGASAGYFIGGRLPNMDFMAIFNTVGEMGTAPLQAKSVFLLQAILNTMLAFVLYFSIENCDENPDIEKVSMIDGLKSIRQIEPRLLVFLLSLTFTSMAAINLSKYTEVYIAKLGFGSEGIGNFVAITGIVGIVTTILIVPQIIKIKKDITVMLVVNVISAVIIYIVFRMSNIMTGLYTLFMLYMVMKTIYAPLETSYISSHAGDGELGKTMGIRQFFFAMGFVIGPLIGGFLYDIKPLYAFDFSVFMFILGFILVLITSNNINKEKYHVAE